jgi:phosphatidylethanolamine/phosphatidyl-N-methylethanolamine N-methyltransferase
VIIVNHFSAEEGKPGWEGMRGWVERRMAPFADKLGWRPVFDIERVLVCEELTLIEKRGLRPWGLFTMMRFRKAKEAKAAA